MQILFNIKNISLLHNLYFHFFSKYIILIIKLAIIVIFIQLFIIFRL